MRSRLNGYLYTGAALPSCQGGPAALCRSGRVGDTPGYGRFPGCPLRGYRPHRRRDSAPAFGARAEEIRSAAEAEDPTVREFVLESYVPLIEGSTVFYCVPYPVGEEGACLPRFDVFSAGHDEEVVERTLRCACLLLEGRIPWKPDAGHELESDCTLYLPACVVDVDKGALIAGGELSRRILDRIAWPAPGQAQEGVKAHNGFRRHAPGPNGPAVKPQPLKPPAAPGPWPKPSPGPRPNLLWVVGVGAPRRPCRAIRIYRRRPACRREPGPARPRWKGNLQQDGVHVVAQKLSHEGLAV